MLLAYDFTGSFADDSQRYSSRPTRTAQAPPTCSSAIFASVAATFSSAPCKFPTIT
jgi:hypothetical protein